MIKPGRIPCCIPHCGRTADERKYGAGAEIICPVHWRMVPRQLKDRYAKVKRLGRKFERLGRDTTRMWLRAVEIWEQCKQSVMP